VPISDLSLFSSMTFALDNTTAGLQTVEQELATGKQVVEPSDNLVNYGQAQLLSARSSAVTNDINTGTQVQGLLTTADNALANAGNWANSAISIATQGADGTVSTAEMATLGTQVQSILQQVIGEGNAGYAGAQLFGGVRPRPHHTTRPATTPAIPAPTSRLSAMVPRFKPPSMGVRFSAMPPVG
jgi:flagellar hook-associated protein 3 FlgL